MIVHKLSEGEEATLDIIKSFMLDIDVPPMTDEELVKEVSWARHNTRDNIDVNIGQKILLSIPLPGHTVIIYVYWDGAVV